MSVYLPIAEMAINPFIVIFFGALVGAMSGLFGVGGGFLMAPILFFLGIPPSIAVATEATQISAASVSGALAHFRRGNLDLKMGVLLTIGGLAGSTAGVALFKLISSFGNVDLLIQISYVVFLGGVGGMMFIESLQALLRRSRGQTVYAKRKHGFMHGLPFRMKFPRSKLYISAILPLTVGFGVGVLSAIMGVGGGFIMVPAMIYLLGMPTLVVVGTSLFYIIFVTASNTIQHAWFNQNVDVVLAILLLIGGVIGAQIGVRLSGRFNAEQLRILLAVIVLGVCLKILFDLLVGGPTIGFSFGGGAGHA